MATAPAREFASLEVKARNGKTVYHTFPFTESSPSFSEKRPGMSTAEVAGVCINTMFGPGLLAIPKAFNDGGFFMTSGLLIIMAITTYFTSKLLAETINSAQRIRPPDAPKKVLEYADLANIYFSPPVAKFWLTVLCMCIMALAIAQMTVVAQALDGFAVFALGETYAVQYHPYPPEVISTSKTGLTPFGPNRPIISIGFLFAMIICMLLGLLDLSSNMIPQYVAFVLFLGGVVEFLRHFAFDEYYPAHNKHMDTSFQPFGPDPALILGVVVFNFAIVITLPSLHDEAASKVSSGNSVGIACIFMAIVYISTGILGSLAYPEAEADFFQYLVSESVPITSRLSVYSFVGGLMLSVPVYSILTVRNLMQVSNSVIVSKGVGTILPWLVAMFLYTSKSFGSFLNWTSLLVMGFANYTFPLTLSAVAMIKHRRLGSIREVWMDYDAITAILMNVVVTSIIILTIFVNVQLALF